MFWKHWKHSDPTRPLALLLLTRLCRMVYKNRNVCLNNRRLPAWTRDRSCARCTSSPWQGRGHSSGAHHRKRHLLSYADFFKVLGTCPWIDASTMASNYSWIIANLRKFSFRTLGRKNYKRCDRKVATLVILVSILSKALRSLWPNRSNWQLNGMLVCSGSSCCCLVLFLRDIQLLT